MSSDTYENALIRFNAARAVRNHNCPSYDVVQMGSALKIHTVYW